METRDASLAPARKLGTNEVGALMIDRATVLTPDGVTGRGLLGVNFPLAPSSELGWLLVEEDFTPVREHEIELTFAVANGYIGTRASLEEGSRLSKPATFAAGI